MNGISVLMPTYNQATFICRAIISVLLQSFKNWELVIIDDGSTDNTEKVICKYLTDERIRYIKNEKNEGLGFSLNRGIEKATYEYIAYLPSDDLFYSNHLKVAESILRNNQDASFVCSGAKINSLAETNVGLEEFAFGKILQIGFLLVQVVHKKSKNLWIERKELVTDSLDEMYWNNLLQGRTPFFTMTVTSEWVMHPYQRHKIINERFGGGINVYRQYYSVNYPVKFQSVFSSPMNERGVSNRLLEKTNDQWNVKLKVLLIGQAEDYVDIIHELNLKAHKLYGIWRKEPNVSGDSVRTIAFENIEHISKDRIYRIKEIKPDIIYCLFDTSSLPFIYDIFLSALGIPFVCHFTEAPFHCLQKGLWEKLIHLYSSADGQVFMNKELQVWYEQFLNIESPMSFVLDGNLPSTNKFQGSRSPKLSSKDGELHTVLIGKYVGLSPNDLQYLAQEKIHIHVYDKSYDTMVVETNEVKYLHFHPLCGPENWLKELSKYDAGWLHIYKSTNFGELLRTNWGDLNTPSIMSMYGAAGLPIIQWDNSEHICASQSFTRKHRCGIFFTSIEDLCSQLWDLHNNPQSKDFLWNNRSAFLLDKYRDSLEEFFYKVIIEKDRIATSSLEKKRASIPKILHQTWKENDIPQHFKVWVDTWKENHKDWEYILWTDDTNREFVRKHYPEFLNIYDLYPSNIQRVDAVRYFILYHFGGVFIDLDYECLRNIEPLLKYEEVVFGSEPMDHCRSFNKDLIVSNAFMGCVPKSDFFAYICKIMEIIQINTKSSLINTLETTGPFSLTKIYKNYLGKEKVKIISAEEICPLTIDETRLVLKGEADLKIQEKINAAYGVHYFWGNWWKDLNKNTNPASKER